MRVTGCGDHVVVSGREQRADPGRDLGAAGHRERASLTEVVLYVDDEQCACHQPSSQIVSIAGSPADSFIAAAGSSLIESARRRRAASNELSTTTAPPDTTRL